jgi:hypothetical protein
MAQDALGAPAARGGMRSLTRWSSLAFGSLRESLRSLSRPT